MKTGKEFFDKFKELHILRKSHEKFIPGETRVNYTGAIYDEREIISLRDASLYF